MKTADIVIGEWYSVDKWRLHKCKVIAVKCPRTYFSSSSYRPNTRNDGIEVEFEDGKTRIFAPRDILRTWEEQEEKQSKANARDEIEKENRKERMEIFQKINELLPGKQSLHISSFKSEFGISVSRAKEILAWLNQEGGTHVQENR